MDPPYREIVFRVRVVRDVRAKLCASPPWYLASDPGPCPPPAAAAAPLLAVAPPGPRLVSWLVSRLVSRQVSRLVSRPLSWLVSWPVSRYRFGELQSAGATYGWWRRGGRFFRWHNGPNTNSCEKRTLSYKHGKVFA